MWREHDTKEETKKHIAEQKRRDKEDRANQTPAALPTPNSIKAEERADEKKRKREEKEAEEMELTTDLQDRLPKKRLTQAKKEEWMMYTPVTLGWLAHSEDPEIRAEALRRLDRIKKQKKS